MSWTQDVELHCNFDGYGVGISINDYVGVVAVGKLPDDEAPE